MLCKLELKGFPVILTHEGSTIRYSNPSIRENDTIRFNLKSGKIEDFAKFEIGNLCMASEGRNMGRIGTIFHRECHLGGFDVAHVKDALGVSFATYHSNIFVIGQGNQAWITLPRDK